MSYKIVKKIKNFLFLSMLAFAVFFTACDGGDEQKECNPPCKSWQTCDDGTCVTAKGACQKDSDCKDTEKCDLPSNKCIDKGAECFGGSKRCNKNNIEICKSDGSAWEIKEKCNTKTCDKDTFSCKDDGKECRKKNSLRCNGNDSQFCNDEGKWETKETCVAPKVCSKTTFKCEEPKSICIPNQKRCNNENDVEICKADGMAWEIAEKCTAPKVCNEEMKFTCVDPSACIGLSFPPAVPDPDPQFKGTYNSLDEVNHYKLILQFFTPLPKGKHDLASGENKNYATCKRCVSVYKLNENNDENPEKRFFQESGTVEVIQGDPSKDKYRSYGRIVNAKLVEVTIDNGFNSIPVKGGKCIEVQSGSPWGWVEDPVCKKDDLKCSFDKKSIQKCNDSNDWIDSKTCDKDTVCAEINGVHECVTCEPNKKRCNNGNIEICKADGSGWEITKCNAPEVCVDGIFECKECVGLTIDKIKRQEKETYGGEKFYLYRQQIDFNTEFISQLTKETPVATYDLASYGTNDNFVTCEQCSFIIKQTGGKNSSMFFQSKGSFEVKEGEPLKKDSIVEIKDLTLIEVAFDIKTYLTTPIEGGSCYQIQTVSWDFIPKCDKDAIRCSKDKKSIEKCNNNNEWLPTKTCNAATPICSAVKGTPTCYVCEPNTKKCSEDGKSVEVCKDDGSMWETNKSCASTESCILGKCKTCTGLSFDSAKEENLKGKFISNNPNTKMKLISMFSEASPKGIYDLASKENKNYQTCKQCVLVFKMDDEFMEIPEKVFFQYSGKLKVVQGDVSKDGNKSYGQIKDAKLAEVIIDTSDRVSEFVEDGECVEIQSGEMWTWGVQEKCTKDTKRCSKDKKILETCNAENEWIDNPCSGATPVCSEVGGVASCTVCIPNEKRCNGDNVEICKVDGSGWKIEDTCAAPKTCHRISYTCTNPNDTSECAGLSINLQHTVEETSWGKIYNYGQKIGENKFSMYFVDKTPVGEYDLAAGDNTNNNTCKQCVLFHEIKNGKEQKIFFQKEGVLTITDGDPSIVDSAGNVRGLKLQEVTIKKEDFSSVPVKNGECLEIETFNWNFIKCNDGDTRCSAEGKYIETCNSNKWTKTETCSDPMPLCSETLGKAKCLACEPNKKRCTSKGVEKCKADGSALDILLTCEAPKVCTPTNFSCIEPGKCIGMSFGPAKRTKSNVYTSSDKDNRLDLTFQFFQVPSTVGEYDLGSFQNSNFKHCNQCVVIYKLDETGNFVEKTFFQESGKLEITSGDGRKGGSGKLINAKLIEVLIDAEYKSTPVENGECFELESSQPSINFSE